VLIARINWGNDGPDLDGFYDFQCAKIMNSWGNEIVTGNPKRKSLLFNSKVFHAKTQRY
jgi:hypothetical protein